MDRLMWWATIQDMLEHMTPEEVVNSLQERYPNKPELLKLVEQLSPSRPDMSTTVLGFCKRAQFEEQDLDWWRPRKSDIEQAMQDVKEMEEQQTPEDIEQEIKELQKERYSMLKLIDQHRSGNPPKGYPLEELIGLVESVDETIAELRERQDLKREAPSAEDLGQMFKFEKLKSMHRKAQVGYGFGYGNDGQTNFSVPNSEGESGDGNPVDNTGDATPSSSYTDHIQSRIKVRREQEEEQARRKKRKLLLDKLKNAQVEPGSLLKKKKNAPATQTSAPAPAPGAANQWEEVGSEMANTTEQTTDTERVTNKYKKTTKDTTDQLKDQSDQVAENTDQSEDLADATDKVTDSANKLRKSLEDLVR